MPVRKHTQLGSSSMSLSTELSQHRSHKWHSFQAPWTLAALFELLIVLLTLDIIRRRQRTYPPFSWHQGWSGFECFRKVLSTKAHVRLKSQLLFLVFCSIARSLEPSFHCVSMINITIPRKEMTCNRLRNPLNLPIPDSTRTLCKGPEITLERPFPEASSKPQLQQNAPDPTSRGPRSGTRSLFFHSCRMRD